MNCNHIFDKYREKLKQVDTVLSDIFSGNTALLQLIGNHIIKSGGKRLRPLILLLSAKLCGYKGKADIQCAAIIEAIHTASLLHDDVIDSAVTRRGNASANKLFGNQIVILVGDYLYSNSLRIAVGMNNQKIMQILAHATTTMTEGEILQLQHTADSDITVEEYFSIISAKTGALMSAASRLGAVLASAEAKTEKRLADFGLHLGIAFQLADDLLDYTAREGELGKKLGKDLEEGKITMPLIFLLKSASDDEKEEISRIIKSHSAKNRSLRRILHLCNKYNAIEKSTDTAQTIVQKAKSALSFFKPCEEKDMLEELTDYALRRDR